MGNGHGNRWQVMGWVCVMGNKDRESWECDRAESMTEWSGNKFKSRESNWGGTWLILRLKTAYKTKESYILSVSDRQIVGIKITNGLVRNNRGINKNVSETWSRTKDAYGTSTEASDDKNGDEKLGWKGKQEDGHGVKFETENRAEQKLEQNRKSEARETEWKGKWSMESKHRKRKYGI